MSPAALPQFSLGTAALAIFAVCAAFVLLRGITRMILGTVVLGLSAWAAFFVWQQAPAWSVAWTGKSLPWLTNGLPATAFVASGYFLRKVANFAGRPFGGASGPHTPRSLAGTFGRLILALVPTSLISAIGVALVHHGGSVAEVRASSGKTADTLTSRLKRAIDTELPASWLAALDPLADPARVALAKLIAARATPVALPEFDPATGKPIPRAIVVNDPELQTLAREGKFDTLLRHPRLTKALADPRVRKLLHR